MAADVEKYISELRHSVTVASLNYEIWWVFKSQDSRPKYADTLNRYLLFFSTSIHAHFVALLVVLYRLYETRRGTYNIPQLLRITKSHFKADDVEQFEELYARAKPLWTKVSILRNKAFGHRSTSHTVEEAFVEAGVTPNELGQLVDLTKELLNRVSNAYDGSTHAFNLGAREDTIRMLEKLSSGS